MAFLVLAFTSACTENTADQDVYEQGVDKTKLINGDKKSVDKRNLVNGDKQSVDKRNLVNGDNM